MLTLLHQRRVERRGGGWDIEFEDEETERGGRQQAFLMLARTPLEDLPLLLGVNIFPRPPLTPSIRDVNTLLPERS
ncbi:hypothetical protein TNCV_3082391 [Trichonephila clavipes]|nr:hypothetical protein TNCV_3082391 [Trichonephila clavipes]